MHWGNCSKEVIMKKFLLLGIALLLTTSVQAAYVLPYPSYMPGNKLYAASRVLDRLKSYWYRGSIAQFKYRLSLADKYLVEAKTLFEYDQYLLAVDSLKRSNQNVQLLPSFVQMAKQEGKDTVQLEATLQEAMGVHTLVLQELEARLPREFTWQPEKEAPTVIPISQLLIQARQERVKLQTHVQ